MMQTFGYEGLTNWSLREFAQATDQHGAGPTTARPVLARAGKTEPCSDGAEHGAGPHGAGAAEPLGRSRADRVPVGRSAGSGALLRPTTTWLESGGPTPSRTKHAEEPHRSPRSRIQFGRSLEITSSSSSYCSSGGGGGTPRQQPLARAGWSESNADRA
jgi:hypothetical protein